MKIGIITSNHNRHKYFANQIAKSLDVVAVVSEEKSFIPLNYAREKSDLNLISKHFQTRSEQEKKDFDNSFNKNLDVLSIEKNSINSSEVFDYLRSKKIDYIFVYGPGIIGKETINAYPRRIINMHLGLSPYYRGSGTNFWPIVNGEVQYCGVTIHFLDEGIDTGDLIFQGRASVNKNDTIHSLGSKIIKVGIKLICESIDAISKDNFSPLRQDLSIGKTYYRKDFNADAVKKAYENIENNLFGKYQKKQHQLLKGVPVYEVK